MHRKQMFSYEKLSSILKLVKGQTYLATGTYVANGMVWMTVCYFTASCRGRGEGGGVGQICLHSVTQSYTTWPPGGESSEGGCVPYPLFQLCIT
jgi:hypothetical protein